MGKTATYPRASARPCRRRAALRLAAVPLGLALLLVPASSMAAANGAAKAIPDVTVLFGRAVKIVRGTNPPTFAGAIVLEADGMTRGGQCSAMGCSGGRGTTTATGIVSWRFVFNNQGWRSRFATATIVSPSCLRRRRC